MERKSNFFQVFFVVVLICVTILVLSFFGKLKFLSSFLEKGTAAIQATTFGVFKKLSFISEGEKVKKMEEINLELLSRVSSFEKLKKENQALSDQFKMSYPLSYNLLKADVIGVSTFIPGVSVPENFILNKGTKDNLKVGMPVVVKDNLIGIISQVSVNISKVELLNNSSISFAIKTQNGAVGIFKGGPSLTITDILLSENIKEGELVLTKGEIDSGGVGLLPDLVVGKIKSVEKKPSDLFQKAEITSFINFVNLNTVFVYTQIK